ncbi:MAG: DUF192 domain-containing protein [Steroidobacteraceae bacterium]
MTRASSLTTLLAIASFGASGASDDSLPPGLARLPVSELEIRSDNGTHRIRAWIAADDESRTRGLMQVRELAADRGMLFLFDRPQFAAFWMKDTPISLDILFVAADGRIVNIARNTTPFSLAPIGSIAPITAVLEMAAGSAKRLGIVPGDCLRHAAFDGQALTAPARRDPYRFR